VASRARCPGLVWLSCRPDIGVAHRARVGSPTVTAMRPDGRRNQRQQSARPRTPRPATRPTRPFRDLDAPPSDGAKRLAATSLVDWSNEVLIVDASDAPVAVGRPAGDRCPDRTVGTRVGPTPGQPGRPARPCAALRPCPAVAPRHGLSLVRPVLWFSEREREPRGVVGWSG
jgi:hypothetical protein